MVTLCSIIKIQNLLLKGEKHEIDQKAIGYTVLIFLDVFKLGFCSRCA